LLGCLGQRRCRVALGDQRPQRDRGRGHDLAHGVDDELLGGLLQLVAVEDTGDRHERYLPGVDGDDLAAAGFGCVSDQRSAALLCGDPSTLTTMRYDIRCAANRPPGRRAACHFTSSAMSYARQRAARTAASATGMALAAASSRNAAAWSKTSPVVRPARCAW